MKKVIITLAMCTMFILPGCINSDNEKENIYHGDICLLYTSDAADDP